MDSLNANLAGCGGGVNNGCICSSVDIDQCEIHAINTQNSENKTGEQTEQHLESYAAGQTMATGDISGSCLGHMGVFNNAGLTGHMAMALDGLEAFD